MASLTPLQLPEPSAERDFDALDPLDSRYFDAELNKYLSERGRIAYQAYVEAALAQTLAEFGLHSPEIAKAITAATQKVTAEAVYAEEQTTKHDIKALVNCIKTQLDDNAKPFVHFGATSYDIIATACALQLRDACHQVVIPRLKELMRTLVDLTEKYAETPQIGRTHGQHGVPITFGFALAEYVSRLGESTLAVQDLAARLRGKFSGAVGAYNALGLFVADPVAFERSLLGKLDLEPAPYSTQIIPAENTIRLLDELTITAGIMANLAHDMRHLQRSEIAEVREHFEAGQTGSSTMAHKRNPINFENVISLSKQVTAQMLNANLNIVSEHQRDLTDSASSRFYGVLLACVASMSKRLNRVMSQLEVDSENMKRNLLLTKGVIAAEPLYLLLEKYGHTTAHEKSKALAHRALADHARLHEVIVNDPDAVQYWHNFTPQERQIITEPENHYTGLSAQKAKAVAGFWKA